SATRTRMRPCALATTRPMALPATCPRAMWSVLVAWPGASAPATSTSTAPPTNARRPSAATSSRATAASGAASAWRSTSRSRRWPAGAPEARLARDGSEFPSRSANLRQPRQHLARLPGDVLDDVARALDLFDEGGGLAAGQNAIEHVAFDPPAIGCRLADFLELMRI